MPILKPTSKAKATRGRPRSLHVSTIALRDPAVIRKVEESMLRNKDKHPVAAATRMLNTMALLEEKNFTVKQ